MDKDNNQVINIQVNGGNGVRNKSIYTMFFFWEETFFLCLCFGFSTKPLSKTYASFFSIQNNILFVHRIHALCLTKEIVLIFLRVKIKFFETASAPSVAHDFVRLDDINHLLDQI
jgi:hypothetical protein